MSARKHYIVGKFYKRVKESKLVDYIKYDSPDEVFECHAINGTDACSMNCSYNDQRCDNDHEGWCVATEEELNTGYVELFKK